MSDTKKTFGSLIVLAVGTFLLGMAEYGMEGILPYISHDLGITIPEAGHAISVYALGVCTGATLLIAFHRLSLKKIIFGLVGLIFLGSVLSVTAQNFWWLMAARFISGLPSGAYYGVGSIVAYRLADEEHKSRAVSIMCAGMTFANLLGNPVSTFLSATLSWRLSFALIAVGCIFDLFLVAKFIPNLEPLHDSGNKGQFRFLKRLAPWLIIIATMFGNGGILAWYSYISPALVKTGGLNASLLPLFMVMAGLGMVIGNLLSGWLSDKYKAGLTAAMLQLSESLNISAVFFREDGHKGCAMHVDTNKNRVAEVVF